MPHAPCPMSCYTGILRLCAIGAIDPAEKNLKICSLRYIYLVNDCLNSPSVDCVLSIILQNSKQVCCLLDCDLSIAQQ